MSKKCKAYSESKLGMEPPDNRKAFYAGWDAAMRERLAQPEQEPVAWRAYTPTNGYTLHHHYGEAYRVASQIEPLYTAPQSSKPLTDAR